MYCMFLFVMYMFVVYVVFQVCVFTLCVLHLALEFICLQTCRLDQSAFVFNVDGFETKADGFVKAYLRTVGGNQNISQEEEIPGTWDAPYKGSQTNEMFDLQGTMIKPLRNPRKKKKHSKTPFSKAPNKKIT